MSSLNFISALEDAGVDNWEGIEYAIELFNQEHGEEE